MWYPMFPAANFEALRSLYKLTILMSFPRFTTGLWYMSHVVNYRVLSHVLKLHAHRVLKVLPEKRQGTP